MARIPETDHSKRFTAHTQHISGLLNHPPASLDYVHSYPDRSQTRRSPTQGSFQESPHDARPQSASQSAPQSPIVSSEARGRLRKACDSCSVRKVKCDESGPPCRSCAALDIPCTFQRPSRRRGPPNRHAEAIKKRKVEQSLGAGDPFNGHSNFFSQPTSSVLSAESICPLPTLELLIDDYFTYIHPLIPLPHEPTFRMQLHRRDDLKDRTFLALIANMVAALVASFPRRPRQLFNRPEHRERFPNAGAVIKVCVQVAAEARGPGYMQGDLTIYDALCSYLTCIHYGYTYDFRRARLHLSESLVIQRSLLAYPKLAHRPDDSTTSPSTHSAGLDSRIGIDYVEQEMTRRLYWVTWVSTASMRQIGNADADLMMLPFLSSEQPPPLPVEVDDAWITKTAILEQPPDEVPLLKGFILNLRLLLAVNPFVASEMSVALGEDSDLERQKSILCQCLQKVKRATDSVPSELRLKPSGLIGWPSLENPAFHKHRDGQWAQPGAHDAADERRMHYSKRSIQFEIQKANIYGTQLGSRSYLVEKYWYLCEFEQAHVQQRRQNFSMEDPPYQADPGPIRVNRGLSDRPGALVQQEMAYEQDYIVQDLAMFLSTVNQVSMEPNGTSLCNKIRQVAGTLLHKPFGSEMMTRSSLDYAAVQSYLTVFIDILNRLERLGPGMADGSSPESSGGSGWVFGETSLSAEETEERELIQWASLREHQEKFARDNGFVQESL